MSDKPAIPLYLRLGASLYVPATHTELYSIASGRKYPALRSLIIDTEDAISDSDLPLAYHNIQTLLVKLHTNTPSPRPLLFLRPRHIEALEMFKHLKYQSLIDGFALPKITLDTLPAWFGLSQADKQYLPILETDIHDQDTLARLCDALLRWQSRILSVRIGINDLLGSFALRRNCHTLIYDIGIAREFITQIVRCFLPAGFKVNAPVYECFSEENRAILQREVQLDLLNGLFGKTVIHPWQIDVVQNQYRVTSKQYTVAQRLLTPGVPAVFQLYDQMHEKATHTEWARAIIARAELYGIQQPGSHVQALFS